MSNEFLYRVFCGVFLGISVFAPGFSGSIIAIIMGIYQDLVRIASNPFKDLKQNIQFCLPLGIGAALSAVLFVIGFKFLFETYEKATYFLFIGLITGNIPVIISEVKKHEFKRHYLLGGAIAFIMALTLGLFAAGVGQSGAQGFTSGIHVLALGGFAAGVTAPIPGMSVSMVLIIFGMYSQLIFAAESLLRLDFTYLFHVGVVGVCAVGGLILTSRLIKAVFEKYPGFANTAVLGFMSGSLIGILIQSLQIYDPEFSWLSGGLMLAIGLGTSMLFVVLGRKTKY